MIRFAEGSEATVIDSARARELVGELVEQLGPVRRVLIIPPDYTRYHSGSGELTVMLYELLRQQAHVEILPALGTHTPMKPQQIAHMYPGIPPELFRIHDWRDNLIRLGELPGDEVARLSGGAVDYTMGCELDHLLLDGGWDRIISVGQLVPHEVIGIANHVKNILIGTGGKEIIDKSHFLGAVCNMEKIMGQARTPVRDALNLMARRFLGHVPITYLLTVRAKDEAGKLVTRGLYAGDDEECFEVGARLCQQVNIDLLAEPIQRAIVHLDPLEFKSTWLGNKAIYRTRMALADDAELIILGEGVKEFGEDPAIDRLIRRYGYKGTPHTLDAVRSEADLGGNLSAAAHLIHGASEGRFRITWCAGGLSREEIESVGYAYADPAEMRRLYKVDSLRDGPQVGHDGKPTFYISNPALGLWALRRNFPGGL
ncbi:DUF2088 domain-containing protein [bacterium]|nr:DUF2088 domain-containing protein [bacterium]